MLAIRMQRTGRKGHAMFRMIVQDSRLSPTSGKVVARLGSYDPHAKNLSINKEKASFYLEHGAQPSDRVVVLLKSEGVKLPAWAVPSPKKQSKTRFPEKRRSTAPPEAKTEEPAPQEAAAVEAETTEAEVAPDTANEPAVQEVTPDTKNEPVEAAEAEASLEEEKSEEASEPADEAKEAEPAPEEIASEEAAPEETKSDKE